MAGRMSQRDRLNQLRQEADLKAKEQKERGERTPAPRKKAASKEPASVARVRFVWAVCGPNGKAVETFPYAKEQDARARAEELMDETGKTHFVNKAEEAI